jgi:acyl-CoA thioester hydrolase
MNASLPTHEMEMIVTWGDCDAAGISYYAKTFDWFTNGRMRLLAKYGFPYMEAFHRNGISLVCLTADCAYKKMLRPDETITLRTSVTFFTRTRMTFEYEIYKTNGELAAKGQTTHAYATPEGKACNLKKARPELWNGLAEQWSVFQE